MTQPLTTGTENTSEAPTPIPSTEVVTKGTPFNSAPPQNVSANIKVTADDLFDMYEELDAQEAGEKPEEKEEVVEVPAEEKVVEKVEEPVENVRKAKVGDREVDIAEDAIIKDTIGDKEVEFKVGDAIKAFKSQEEFNRNMDQRLNYVASREKKATSKEEALNNHYDSLSLKAKNMMEAAASGKPRDMLWALAKMAVGDSGVDPAEFYSATLDKFSQTAHLWGKGTPEQKALEAEKLRREALEEKLKVQNKDLQVTKSTQALVTQVKEVCETFKISEGDFKNYYSQLVAEHVGDGEDKTFSRTDEIKVADVAQFIANKTHEKTIIEAIKQVAPNKAADEDLIDAVYFATRSQDLTAKDLEDIVKMAIGQPTKGDENLNGKVQKANQNGLRTQSTAVNSLKKSNSEESAEDKELEEFFFGNRKVR